MISIHTSNKAVRLPDKSNDKINLFLQFYIDKSPTRQKEIERCLKFNANNAKIDKIYLLNERIYTPQELGGLESEKIVQVNIAKRLSYAEFFKYARETEIKGYLILVNSDIFFDVSLENLLYSNISEKKKMFALLRYEYINKKAKIFGPRYDSQDTWIFHSNYLTTPKQEKMFNFQLGKPGCDNKMVYLMHLLGYEVINDPDFIRSYHLHTSNVRNYTREDALSQPWGCISPITNKPVMDSFGINMRGAAIKIDMWNDNDRLYSYIERKLEKGEKFIIPRIAGFENTFAMYGEMIRINQGMIAPEIKEFLEKYVGVLKNNAGLLFRNMEDICEYSSIYMKSFQNSEMFAGWEQHGAVYRHIQESHDYITNKYFNNPSREIVWAYVFDIFHYIKTRPWTTALRGKRILIVSSFAESINEKLPYREKLYDGVDLFPDCQIITIKPPQTQGMEPSLGYFGDDLREFNKKLDLIKDQYDVALVSCGGYGNLVCNHIFESGKSAIYVGGVLQMYFGVLGTRWLMERGDAVRLYLNEYWSRPKDGEKPSNHKTIEKACYW